MLVKEFHVGKEKLSCAIVEVWVGAALLDSRLVLLSDGEKNAYSLCPIIHFLVIGPREIFMQVRKWSQRRYPLWNTIQQSQRNELDVAML